MTELARLDALTERLERESALWKPSPLTDLLDATLKLLREMAAEIAHATDALTPKPAREGIYSYAKRLETTHHHATYWLEGGRNHPDRGHAVIAVEQAVNSWKNAAYGLAEKLEAAEDRLDAVTAERDKFASGVRGLVVDLCRLSDAFGLPSVGSAEPVNADSILAAIESLKAERELMKEALESYAKSPTYGAVARLVLTGAARAASEGNEGKGAQGG